MDPNILKILVGDEASLFQVLTNLFQNAVKFTESGKIEVGGGQDAQPPVDHGQVPLKFWVRDTGKGIHTDLLPTLFEPFTQGENYMAREYV